MKTWSEFLNDNFKKRLRLHQRAPKTRVFPGPGRKDLMLRARDVRSRVQKYFFSPQICFFKLNNTFFLNDRVAAMQFAPSPSLFFTKYFFLGQNTVFSLSEYCFWFLKVGISAIMITSAWLVAPIPILSSANICRVYLVKHDSTFLSWIAPLLLVTSLIVVLVCYILIFRFIKRHVQKSTVAQTSSNRLDVSITKNLLCVVCAFYICVFPYTITLILVLAKFLLTNTVYTISTVVLNANSIVNPFIYAAKHPVFRPIFYQMITGRWSQIQQPSRILKRLISMTMDKNVPISSRSKDCESAL